MKEKKVKIDPEKVKEIWEKVKKVVDAVINALTEDKKG